jgi:hypothetical protein
MVIEGCFSYFCCVIKAMKKSISTLGILFMLALKNPPMPDFALFQKISIVVVHSFPKKQVALQFHMN